MNTVFFFAVLEVEPFHKFRIRVKTEGSEFGSELEVSPAEISLNFEYTPTYPDEPPQMEVVPGENIEDEELEGLREQLQEQVCRACCILKVGYSIFHLPWSWQMSYFLCLFSVQKTLAW